MEGLHLLRTIVEQGDYMCKVDLEDDYLCATMNKSPRKVTCFE